MDAAASALLAARARLTRELSALASAAEASARVRCPYRDRKDVCTFGHGCRNQRPGVAERHCTGAQLDTRPA